MLLRVSVTTLEAFRRVVQTDWASENELYNKIVGKFVYTGWQAGAGKAWHSILQHLPNLLDMQVHADLLGAELEKGMFDADLAKIRLIRWDKHVFYRAQAELAHAELGDGVFEVKATIPVRTDYGPCTLVAKADHLRGTTISDAKCKFGQIAAKEYENDLQWRAYLFVHGARRFCYRCVAFGAEPKEMANGMSLHTARESQSFAFYPYPEMADDVRGWLNRFLHWCHNRGIMHYLEREGTD